MTNHNANNRSAAMVIAIACLLFVAAIPRSTCAQEFDVFDRQVQIHGFASQGYAVSDHNNFLTMNTSQGSFALTDFGFNASTRVTGKLRVGAQIYGRNVGRLGNWRAETDWAYADYRFADAFGVRAGKVKTVLGMYNDTQDMEFLHTWALVPQSMYPVDVRGDTIAHVGADVYGNVSGKKMGTISYTAYAGRRPNDPEGGYLFGLSTSSRITTPTGFKYITSQTKNINNYGGPVFGGDLRWVTPAAGLTVGTSFLKADITTTGFYVLPFEVPYKMTTDRNDIVAVYGEYAPGNLKIAGEFRREVKRSAFNSPVGTRIPGDEDARSSYLAAAYRFTPWLELGTYHSRYVAAWALDHDDPTNHVYDQVMTARFDLTSHINFKVESHFIDGAMINSVLDRGFYAAANPNGLAPKMKMLVMRVGFRM